MQSTEIQQMIETGLPGAIVRVDGDGVHFEATVISDRFEGKSLLEQQRMVYRTLGDHMAANIHALSMKTYTVKQWENAKE